MTHKLLFLLIASAWMLGLGAQSIDLDLETVGTAKPKADLSGSVWAQSGFYRAVGIPARTNTFIWSMGASAELGLQQWRLPFSFTVGQYGNRLQTPTFGQLGVSPTYKWAKAHLGHRNLQFSPYTLAGHTFLGAGVELNPGMFRFAAMYGRLRQVVRPQENLLSILPTYRRTGMALKIGTGTADNYVDLIFFKAKDDPASLAAPQDSTVQPAENMVLGLNSRLNMGKRVSAQLDAAASFFNRNQQSTVLDATELGQLSRWPDKLFPVRYSSRVSFAGKAGLFYTRDAFRMGVQYERIDPEYESMGTYFFLNDIENITITPTFSLFKRRLNFSGNLGVQRNNLLDNRSESTRRWIGNANLSYAQGGKPFGVSANYTNFSINQTDGRVELSDTIRLSLVTTSVNVTPYWNFVSEARTTSVMLAANYQELNDRNPFTREFTDMRSAFVTGNYALMSNTTGWGANIGIQYNNLQLLALDTHRYGLLGGVNRNFGEGKFQLSTNAAYHLTRIAAARDGATLTVSTNVTWIPAAEWTVSAYANFIDNSSAQFNDYYEWIGGIRVGRYWR